MLRRLYRLQPGTGLILALPGLMLGLWYAWTAWASLAVYSASEKTAIDPTLFRIRLHDLALEQLQRLQAPRVSVPLPGLEISVKSGRLPELLKPDQPFLPARIDFGTQTYKHAAVRLRGQKIWHTASAKKSLRVKLDAGDLFEGNRLFNLKNPSEPLPIGEKLLLDLAREQGLMTGDSGFVHVGFNGLDLGVYFYTTPLDEAIIRHGRHIPADLYAPAGRGAWSDPSAWEQIAAYDIKQTDRSELGRLLNQLSAHTPMPAFAAYAADELDLEAFARLGALQLLFGGDADQPVFYGLYHDPYRGKWMPVLDEFEGLRHAGLDDVRPDPLFRRLNQTAAYRNRRNQLARELLHGAASVASLQQRGEALLARLLPSLTQDPYWQANKQLPELNSLYHHLLRPMSADSLRRTFTDTLETHARRLARLEALLAAEPDRPVVPSPSPEQIVLGPGPVEIHGTRVYASHQQVRVLAGTLLRMGPGASLIFAGPVRFEGSAAAPIRVRAATLQRWGGIAVQGPASAGSRLKYVDIAGGSFPRRPGFHYSGMINFHDTRDIRISDSRFADNQGSDDLIHTAYVQQLDAERNRIDNAFSDGWDLEFSQANLTRLTIVGTGDDGVDAMGSRIVLSDSQLLDSRGNGISAGEESRITVSNSLIATSRTGTLAKNASRVTFQASLLYRLRTGLHLEQKALYYPPASGISATDLSLTKVQVPLLLDGRARKQSSLQPAFTTEPTAQLNLLRQRLGLSDWQGLEARLRTLRDKGVRE